MLEEWLLHPSLFLKSLDSTLKRNCSFCLFGFFLTSDGWKTDYFGCFYNFLSFQKPRRLDLITTLPLNITRFERVCQLIFGSS